MRKILLASVILLGVFPAAAMAGDDGCGGGSGYRGAYSNYDYESRPQVIYHTPRQHYSRPVVVIQTPRYNHHVRSHGHHAVRHHDYGHDRGGDRGHHGSRRGHH